MKSVVLRQAYLFTCPRCGCDTMAMPTIEKVSAEERVAIARLAEMPPDDLGDWWESEPDEVVCPHCDITYGTRLADPLGGDDDDPDRT